MWRYIWSPNNFIQIFGNLSFAGTYILIRHYNTSGISRISFRVVRNMMLPLECSFRTILTLTYGRFCSVGHALQGGLQLIVNDLAAFLEINPTGISTNTDRVMQPYTSSKSRPVLFFNQKYRSGLFLSFISNLVLITKKQPKSA